MVDEVKEIMKEKKPRVKKKIEEVKPVETPKIEEKKEEPKVEEKKIETKKVEKKIIELPPKDKAIVNAFSIGISTKHSKAIGKMIRGKSPDKAIEILELVLQERRAVPMRGWEIPHRKRGLMVGNSGGSGRFPKNASKEFIDLIKQLKANCDVNKIENPVITKVISNIASRPFKREGRRAKRTHVYIEAKNKMKKEKK